MRNLIFCISIVFLLSCSNPTHNKNSVEISSHIIDITLDECVDSFYVRRIISDTPLSQIHYLQIVNDRLFLWDNGGIIYYMKGDSIVSKLEAIGRGHGEYQYISAFAFSEPDSALFVHSGSNSKILKYSVPSFDFVSSINCELGIRAMRVYDGKIIAFCSTPGVNSSRHNGLYEINPETGDNNLLLPMNQISSNYIDNTSFFYHNEELCFLVPDYDNTIYKYSEGLLTKTDEFHYGKLNLDREFFAVDETDAYNYSQLLMKLLETEHCLGGYLTIMQDEADYMFWRALGTQDRQILLTKVSGKDSRSYNILMPGMNALAFPNNVNDGWNIKVCEGPVVSLTEDESKLTRIGREITDSLRQQSYDNPVLLYYKLKETL
ncbi:MAG: 6-bladed beta-propeller [Bacteroidaceae bacterium]|jgi:hypothetical protein|nr:6-bladed beta-propeller [Bacteroidaceae bacterium]HOD68618.1 6-bladed beta-propeller [Bacteroidaceae bacterium]HQL26118.1 6-bladed beta-propeller [Bacteroidaceae bacterium]